jgi:hypothetical protein
MPTKHTVVSAGLGVLAGAGLALGGAGLLTGAGAASGAPSCPPAPVAGSGVRAPEPPGVGPLSPTGS